MPQNNALNSSYLLQVYYTSYSLPLHHFLNFLIQYANFFKIRQIYNIKKAIGGLFADFKKLEYCMRELRNWLSRKLYYKLVASMSSFIQCFAAVAGSLREKTKMDITRPPLNGITFLSSGKHVLTTGEKSLTSILSL